MIMYVLSEVPGHVCAVGLTLVLLVSVVDCELDV